MLKQTIMACMVLAMCGCQPSYKWKVTDLDTGKTYTVYTYLRAKPERNNHTGLLCFYDGDSAIALKSYKSELVGNLND